MKTSNGTYTWNNQREVERQIAFRLDRFLVLDFLLQNHINISTTILPMMGLDHWLVFLIMDLEGPHKKIPFIFENF